MENNVIAVYELISGDTKVRAHSFVPGMLSSTDVVAAVHDWIVDYYKKANEALRLDKKEGKVPKEVPEIEVDLTGLRVFKLEELYGESK